MTACLTLPGQTDSGIPGLNSLIEKYRVLDISSPGLEVFHTRLGLSFADAIGSFAEPDARSIALGLIDRAVDSRDGYVARHLTRSRGSSPAHWASETSEG